MARRTYTSPAINVSFDARRCIHSANCLRGLPQVFDLEAKPWIMADAAAADDVAAVVERCPSGALLYERIDGGAAEGPDSDTTVYPIPDGPIMIRGDVTLLDADGNAARRRLSRDVVPVRRLDEQAVLRQHSSCKRFQGSVARPWPDKQAGWVFD